MAQNRHHLYSRNPVFDLPALGNEASRAVFADVPASRDMAAGHVCLSGHFSLPARTDLSRFLL